MQPFECRNTVSVHGRPASPDACSSPPTMLVHRNFCTFFVGSITPPRTRVVVRPCGGFASASGTRPSACSRALANPFSRCHCWYIASPGWYGKKVLPPTPPPPPPPLPPDAAAAAAAAIDSISVTKRCGRPRFPSGRTGLRGEFRRLPTTLEQLGRLVLFSRRPTSTTPITTLGTIRNDKLLPIAIGTDVIVCILADLVLFVDLCLLGKELVRIEVLFLIVVFILEMLLLLLLLIAVFLLPISVRIDSFLLNLIRSQVSFLAIVLHLCCTFPVSVTIGFFILPLLSSSSPSGRPPVRCRLRSVDSSSSSSSSSLPSSPPSPLRDNRRRLLDSSGAAAAADWYERSFAPTIPSPESAASPSSAKKLTRFLRSKRSFCTHWALYLKKASMLRIQLAHMFAS
uniref:Uncharacterized protein n=1 Tax=Anopheles merus TaxID=30066 RepID=A0A182V4K8_ANOME